jgi:hypothetical protein
MGTQAYTFSVWFSLIGHSGLLQLLWIICVQHNCKLPVLSDEVPVTATHLHCFLVVIWMKYFLLVLSYSAFRYIIWVMLINIRHSVLNCSSFVQSFWAFIHVFFVRSYLYLYDAPVFALMQSASRIRIWSWSFMTLRLRRACLQLLD